MPNVSPVTENAARIPSLASLKVRIYADGADLTRIGELRSHPLIRGFTTNPTLMRNSGITDYEAFARDALRLADGLPVSFEVVADDFAEMERQARRISSWGDNVAAKIPVTDTQGRSSVPLVRRLSADGIPVNVTAVMTARQAFEAAAALAAGARAQISIFAGRVADTGRDPACLVAEVVEAIRTIPNIEVIWASPREVWNVFQADAAGCHIITLTPDLLAKLDLIGKDPEDYSLETVRMFHRDAARSGLAL